MPKFSPQDFFFGWGLNLFECYLHVKFNWINKYNEKNRNDHHVSVYLSYPSSSENRQQSRDFFLSNDIAAFWLRKNNNF